MMMMFALDSLVHQKEGAQGEQEEEEADGRSFRRKEGPTGTPTLGADLTTLGQGCRMRGAGEIMDGGVGY